MGGSAEWDNRMMDSLKNFDLSSPEVKQQFGEFLNDSSLAVTLKTFTRFDRFQVMFPNIFSVI